MNETWRGIAAGCVGIIVLFGLGGLEVFNGLSQSARLQLESTAGGSAATRWQDLLIEQGNLLALELGPPADARPDPDDAPSLSGATRASESGQTVLEVDQRTHRLVSVNGLGRIRVAEVSDTATVLTEDKRAADLARVSVGDLIEVQPRDGRVQRIVVLRHATAETGIDLGTQGRRRVSSGGGE